MGPASTCGDPQGMPAVRIAAAGAVADVDRSRWETGAVTAAIDTTHHAETRRHSVRRRAGSGCAPKHAFAPRGFCRDRRRAALPGKPQVGSGVRPGSLGRIVGVSCFYDPTTGQFLTRDPINAVTRSAYGYVGNNPLNATDPSGLWCVTGVAGHDANGDEICNGAGEIAQNVRSSLGICSTYADPGCGSSAETSSGGKAVQVVGGVVLAADAAVVCFAFIVACGYGMLFTATAAPVGVLAYGLYEWARYGDCPDARNHVTAGLNGGGVLTPENAPEHEVPQPGEGNDPGLPPKPFQPVPGPTLPNSPPPKVQPGGQLP